MRLQGQQYQQLMDALLSAFPTPARLYEMVWIRLEKNLHEIVSGENLRYNVFQLIQAAEAEGWLDCLVLSARESVPSNASLLAFAQQWGMAPTGTPAKPELERLIRETNAYLDVSSWRTKLGEIEAQVCRVEIGGGEIYGTGFLLGPDSVITNYHVVADVYEGKNFGPGDVLLRFDYKQLPDGKTLNEGTEYRLAQEGWLIDHSPKSPFDEVSGPLSTAPDPSHLDYALLRVDGAPGQDTVGNAQEPNASTRKWIDIPAVAPEFIADSPLFIVQHPQAEPLKLALDTNAVIGVNANGTRVRYRTNTERGSSGSPCFNQNWELVALHHVGDPNFASPYNQGVTFSAIAKRLKIDS
jgi:V8-like Glu-specific endopeptidase